MQRPDDELIEKFFKSLCTKEEATQVIEYLKANPDHPYLLKEWAEADGYTALPKNYTQQMFDAVDAAILKPEKKTAKLFWRVAVAATLAGILISVFFLNKKMETGAIIAKKDTLQREIWVTKYNTLQQDLLITLADGSVISLSPNASVRYHNDFNQYSKREIYMTGHAFYRVAKNKAKPFIVYSNNISTTALGTAFSVTTGGIDNSLSVKLFEGKVVVADTAYHDAAKNYYLLPGQELLYDTKSRKGLVKSFFKKNSIGKIDNKKIMPDTQSLNESYMFNNQTLAEVLDQLSAMYHVDIEYSKANTGNIYFIGKVDRTDSLEKTINDIALLNKLSVKKLNGKYIMKRKQ